MYYSQRGSNIRMIYQNFANFEGFFSMPFLQSDKQSSDLDHIEILCADSRTDNDSVWKNMVKKGERKAAFVACLVLN